MRNLSLANETLKPAARHCGETLESAMTRSAREIKGSK
jgi:hypothetical protein